jgi:catechol 2,3-dioxygenase-like lactoylglutathione lyase family enzyme
MLMDHLILTVSDIERTIEFYKRVLGAEVVQYNEWKAGKAPSPGLLFGLTRLKLHTPDMKNVLKAKLPVPGAGNFCFQWEGNISAAISHLNSVGVALELGPVERIGAHGRGKSVYFRDPDGNLIELLSYLP